MQLWIVQREDEFADEGGGCGGRRREADVALEFEEGEAGWGVEEGWEGVWRGGCEGERVGVEGGGWHCWCGFGAFGW